MKRKYKKTPHHVPNYHTVTTDNDRHFISGISNEQMERDLERYGELAANDARRPWLNLRIFRRDGQLLAEDS